jgi:hypothetical protein
MLVLLMEAIYEVPFWVGLMWHDIGTRFHDDRSGIQTLWG